LFEPLHRARYPHLLCALVRPAPCRGSPPPPIDGPSTAATTLLYLRVMKIAVVTGTSTGIGFATSLHLARHDYRVFAGMRNLAKAGPLRAAGAEARLPIEVVELDVTSRRPSPAPSRRCRRTAPSTCWSTTPVS